MNDNENEDMNEIGNEGMCEIGYDETNENMNVFMNLTDN